MSLRRMMLLSLGAKIKNLIEAFKTRVFAVQGEFEAETCMNTQLTGLDNNGLLDSASLIVTPNAYEENILFAVEPDNVGTNLLLHSQDWTQTVWAKGGATIVSSTRVAPDGTSTGTELSDVGASSTPGVTVQSFNTTSTIVTYSIYTKAISLPTNGRRLFLLRNSTTGTNFDILNFNYSSTGNLGNGWFSQNVGNGWFRLSYTRTTGINIGNLLTVYYGRGDTAPVGATDVWQVWGAQIDTSNTLNDYIPTTSVRIINGTIGDMSVTRVTTGTRVNADGLIEEVPYNLLSQSQNFENGFWNKQRTTIGQNVIAAPDGTLTADNLIANSGVTYDYTGVNGVNVVSSPFPLNTEQRTLSFYLKYNGLNRIRVIYGSSTSLLAAVFVEVDLQLGSITSSNGGIVASNFFIEDAGNGWYRVGFNLITTLSTTNNRFAVGLGDTTKTIANGIDGVYVWGAQLVTGTQAKDYFPTTNRFNIPRIDYSTGSCPSILVEPQRTNLVTFSEQFDNAIWVKSNTIVTPDTATSPSGTLTADTLFGDGITNNFRLLGCNTALSVGLTSISVFAKKNTNNFIQLIASSVSFGADVWANFDLNNGTLGTIGSATTARIENYGNGWYRCTIIGTSTSSSSPSFNFALITSATSVRAELNTLTTSVFLWGAQAELGPNATSYIPTTTATVTRNADVISNTNATTLIGQTEGTIFVEFVPKVVNSDIIRMTENISTFNNGFFILINSQGNLQCLIRANGVTSINHVIPVNISNTPIYKVAIKYSSGNTKIFVNGILRITNTTVYAFSLPLTRIQMDNAQWTGNNQTRAITNVSLWKTQITDAQAINITTL